MNNPIPILHHECGRGLILLAKQTRCNPSPPTIRAWATGGSIPEHTRTVLLPRVLVAWGEQVRAGNHDTANALWDCYFPGTKPHVYHLLYGLFNLTLPQLAKWSGFTTGRVLKILGQPKLTKRQLQNIGGSTMRYYESLWSAHTWDGRDPRAVRLYAALRDQARVYQPGELRI